MAYRMKYRILPALLISIVLSAVSLQAAPAATSDLNGDGKSDLLWTNATTGETAAWLMNGLGISSSASLLVDPNWRVSATPDLNGDGKADLLWYNAATGQTAAWLMSGTTQLSGALLLTDLNWRVTATGDFNGDGKSDLLWYNAATGQTAMWLMNGLTQASGAVLLADPNWKVTGVADLNGDTKSDLLWYNPATGQTAAWLMNGLTQSSGTVLLTDPNWKVTGTADLNGDGKADLIWTNAPAGQTAAWLMNGLTQTSGTVLLTDASWKVMATADLNGDGKTDLLWYNASSGQTAAWLMNGLSQSSGTVLLADLNWKVTATLDLNGDGKSDLLWYNASSGQTAAWLMNGLSISGSATLLTDSNWRVRSNVSSGDTSIGVIGTVAGNGGNDSGDGGAAIQAQLYGPEHVAVDAAGNLYIADTDTNRIRKLTPAGIITTVAGAGVYGFRGDGGPATSALLAHPTGIAVDAAGNLYITDSENQRIRKVTPNGIINTIAGTGSIGFGGDGGAATSALLNYPDGLALDAAGNLYIADTNNNRVRQITPGGIISTVAGTGTGNFGGDGGLATAALLRSPYGVAVDSNGSLYIADTFNNRIRKVTSGVISTFAGTGVAGFNGDGGLAGLAQLNTPVEVIFDSAGNAIIADLSNNRIRQVTPVNIISTIAGSGTGGFGGDGGAATSALLSVPFGVGMDAAGNLFIADNSNNRIREVTSGVIRTVAGTGVTFFGGDGGAARSAQLNHPISVAVDTSGNMYISDTENNRIRKVTSAGVTSTIAGTGTGAFSGDGGQATSASVSFPGGLSLDRNGNLYFADISNNRIRMVTPSGVISTVAGTGAFAFGTDGVVATASAVVGIAVVVDASGNLYIAEKAANRVRKVTAAGIISTIAGTGVAGFSGDGGAATSALLTQPTDVAVDAAGNVYIADAGNNAIRMVTPDGVIRTVAGTGAAGFSGDGGAAASAQLNGATDIVVDAAGNLYIADTFNHRVRRVTAGVITTVVGTGDYGFAGDGGLSTAAQIYLPQGLFVNSAGDLYIADSYNNRIRKVVISN